MTTWEKDKWNEMREALNKISKGNIELKKIRSFAKETICYISEQKLTAKQLAARKNHYEEVRKSWED